MGRSYIIGFELNHREAQLCRYDHEKEDAVSVTVTVGGSMASFPALLSYDPEKDKWNYGIEARYMAEQKNAFLIGSLLEKSSSGEGFSAAGREYSPAEILARFIKGALTMAGITDPAGEIAVFVITVPRTTKELAANMKAAFEMLGIEGRAFLQDHDESFYYHTLFQRVEVFSRNVGLFWFYDTDKVSFSTLKVNRGTRPVTVSVRNGNGTNLPADAEARDAEFSTYVKEALAGEDYSGIFLVGKGFDQNWAHESMRQLCRGKRKVFSGDNLFAKGACYAAFIRNGGSKLKGYLFLGSDIVRKNVSMDMLRNGKPEVYPLVVAGNHWYEAEKCIEFIADDTDEVVLNISSMDTGERSRMTIKAEGLPERPRGAVRFRLEMSFASPQQGCVKLTDLGFGDMFPASGLSWQENI